MLVLEPYGLISSFQGLKYMAVYGLNETDVEEMERLWNAIEGCKKSR